MIGSRRFELLCDITSMCVYCYVNPHRVQSSRWINSLTLIIFILIYKWDLHGSSFYWSVTEPLCKLTKRSFCNWSLLLAATGSIQPSVIPLVITQQFSIMQKWISHHLAKFLWSIPYMNDNYIAYVFHICCHSLTIL